MEKLTQLREMTGNRKSFSTWLLLHFNEKGSTEKYHETIKEDKSVELKITLNGVEMTRVGMDEAMDEITAMHLDQLGATEGKLKRDREEFNRIVVEKAEELIKDKMENLEELLYDVKENLNMIDSLATNNISWKEEK